MGSGSVLAKIVPGVERVAEGLSYFSTTKGARFGNLQWCCYHAHQKKSPVVVTFGVSVLQDLTRTKAVLGGL